MAIDTTPQALADAAACYSCLSPGQVEAVKTYLLAVKAGGSLDPQVLAEDAKCFLCLSPGIMKAVQTYLMAQIVNAA